MLPSSAGDLTGRRLRGGDPDLDEGRELRQLCRAQDAVTDWEQGESLC